MRSAGQGEQLCLVPGSPQEVTPVCHELALQFWVVTDCSGDRGRAFAGFFSLFQGAHPTRASQIDEKDWSHICILSPLKIPKVLGPNTFAFAVFLLWFFFFFLQNSDKINCISLSVLLQEGGRETVIAPHGIGSEL